MLGVGSSGNLRTFQRHGAKVGCESVEPPLPAPEDAMTAEVFRDVAGAFLIAFALFTLALTICLKRIEKELKRYNDREERRP